MQKQRLYKYYKNIIVEDVLLVQNYSTIMQLPQVNHAILSTTSKLYLSDKKESICAFAACYLLTGQKSVPTRARKSIAAFKLREKSLIGCLVTLRGEALYALMDKILSFSLPRLAPPTGVGALSRRTSTPSKGGSYYTVGVSNMSFIPEVELFFELFDSIHGVNILFSFTTPKIKKSTQVSETYLATSKIEAPVTKELFHLDSKNTCMKYMELLDKSNLSLLLSALQYPDI